MSGLKVQLDELELFIGLLTAKYPHLKTASYATLAEELNKEFGVDATYEDIFLLYEPTVEELELEARILYGDTFNFYPNEQY